MSLILAILVGISGCSDDGAEIDEDNSRDPLIEQALGDHLMVDPDLASQNEANAVLTIGFDSSIPPLVSGPDQRDATIEATRRLLLEGGSIADLPLGSDDREWANLAGALTAAERASRIDFAKECADGLNYSAIWAARLPEYAVIAPYGSVVEAAGNSKASCNIRIVTYLSDLPVEEIMQFYFTLAERAKLDLTYTKGDENAIQAVSKRAKLVVHARKRNGFQTEVDVISREYEDS